MSTSPTQLTLKYLREAGYTCDIVERRITKWTTRDFLGFADILAVKPGTIGVLAVQTTTVDNQSTRKKKVMGIDALQAWLDAGNRFEVHGWAKKGPRGKRKLWAVNVNEICLSGKTK